MQQDHAPKQKSINRKNAAVRKTQNLKPYNKGRLPSGSRPCLADPFRPCGYRSVNFFPRLHRLDFFRPVNRNPSPFRAHVTQQLILRGPISYQRPCFRHAGFRFLPARVRHRKLCELRRHLIHHQLQKLQRCGQKNLVKACSPLLHKFLHSVFPRIAVASPQQSC